MSALSEWIKKNAKDGADISEAEKLIEETTVAGIDSKEKADNFMMKNKFFKSALDFRTTESVNNHDEKFKNEKLPAILKEEREKIMKELNPDETPEQKELRELKEWKEKSIQDGKVSELKSELRAKAKELGYDPIRAERFAVYGEDAMKTLEEEAGFIAEAVKGGLEQEIKGRFGNNPPPRQQAPPSEKVMIRDEYMNLSPKEQSSFIADGGSVVDK